MKYICDKRKQALLDRLKNQAMRIHVLKNRHTHIESQVGPQMAQVQATCDRALATDAENLLTTATALARPYLEKGSPNAEVEAEIERLVSCLERRTYPSRWIIDFKTSDPPIDGLLSA